MKGTIDLTTEIIRIVKRILEEEKMKGANRYVVDSMGKVQDVMYRINESDKTIDKINDTYITEEEVQDMLDKLNLSSFEDIQSAIDSLDTRLTNLENNPTGATTEQLEQIDQNTNNIQNHETRIMEIEVNGTNQDDIEKLKQSNRTTNINLMKEIANRQIADDALGYNYPDKKTADFTDLYVDTLADNSNIESTINCRYDRNLKVVRPYNLNVKRPTYSETSQFGSSNGNYHLITKVYQDDFMPDDYTIYVYKLMDNGDLFKMEFGGYSNPEDVTEIIYSNKSLNNQMIKVACYNQYDDSIFIVTETKSWSGELRLAKIDLSTNNFEIIGDTYGYSNFGIDYCYFYNNKIFFNSPNSQDYRIFIFDIINNSLTRSSAPPNLPYNNYFTNVGGDIYILDTYFNKITAGKFDGTDFTFTQYNLDESILENLYQNSKPIFFYLNNDFQLLHGNGFSNKSYKFNLVDLKIEENKEIILKSDRDYDRNNSAISNFINITDYDEFGGGGMMDQVHRFYLTGFTDGEKDYLHQIDLHYNETPYDTEYNPDDPNNQEGFTIETKDMETSELLQQAFSYITIYENSYGFVQGVYYSRDSGTTWSTLVNKEELIDISNQPTNQKVRLKIHLMHDAELVHYGIGGMP